MPAASQRRIAYNIIITTYPPPSTRWTTNMYTRNTSDSPRAVYGYSRWRFGDGSRGRWFSTGQRVRHWCKCTLDGSFVKQFARSFFVSYSKHTWHIITRALSPRSAATVCIAPSEIGIRSIIFIFSRARLCPRSSVHADDTRV